MRFMTIPTMVPASNGGVLIASASSSLREQVMHSFQDRFQGRRWPVQEAMGGADALTKLESGNWQLLYLDRRLPDLDADELVDIIKRKFPGIQVVVVDSDGSPGPPFESVAAENARRQEMKQSGSMPPGALESRNEMPAIHEAAEVLPGMIGNTARMQRLYRMARLVAPCMATVLITGPTGTGKELVARAVHKLSPRCTRAFVVVNCAAIPESLLESELFGHIRGAFTGAVQTSAGRIAAAQGGTLFLDEVGELPLSMQAKLLRFLDQKEVQRLGSAEVFHADVRVIAATNADLGQAVDAGRFRSDLYYRLSAFPLELPPLAERGEDVLLLAEHFLHTLARGGPPRGLSAEAGAMLQAHGWPGNVRELHQVIERALILADGDETISPEHLYFPSRGSLSARNHAYTAQV
jgi:DNA-binding NtrC family response regulator